MGDLCKPPDFISLNIPPHPHARVQQTLQPGQLSLCCALQCPASSCRHALALCQALCTVVGPWGAGLVVWVQ